MNCIYDNGYTLLGMQKDLIKHLNNTEITSDNEEIVYDMIKELKEFNKDDIISINYEYGMGYHIEYWEKEDIVKEA